MRGRTDIYDYKKQLDTLKGYLEKQGMSPANKNSIEKFIAHCQIMGLSDARIIRYYYAFKYFNIFFEKDFNAATKEDVEAVVAKINSKETWSPTTKHDMRVMLKRFYKWLYGKDEEYPPEVKWIKTKIKRTDKKLPNEGELLTEDDIEKAIAHANNLRDRALISTLYEAGCRIGELCSLRIMDVSFDKMGTVLAVTGKTGPRKIRVVASTPHLAAWISSHPFQRNRESPMWICLDIKKECRKADYDTIRLMLNDVFQKAGIHKRHNPHLFRHSRATIMASHLTEFQMNQYFGWIQGSKMPSTYVHLSGKNIDDAILKFNGMNVQEDSKPKNSSIICRRCDTINKLESTYCCKCGCVVDVVTALKIEEEQKEADRFREVSKEILSLLKKERPELVMEMMKRVG